MKLILKKTGAGIWRRTINGYWELLAEAPNREIARVACELGNSEGFKYPGPSSGDNMRAAVKFARDCIARIRGCFCENQRLPDSNPGRWECEACHGTGLVILPEAPAVGWGDCRVLAALRRQIAE